ncbi:MAG: hypothetical protein EOP54_20565 [Sphingobacteriales bacterium]|nr:MAG: hypothetical protein EOP54_20565 [Sphingobacteriales bacterium]
MKIISTKFHGILDYLVVIFLAVSPMLFKMEGFLCSFTYALAGVHFLLTILTRYELGLIKVIPFRIHGLIELVVSLALVGVAFYFNSQGNTLGFYFYIWLGVVILRVFFCTDFLGGPARGN